MFQNSPRPHQTPHQFPHRIRFPATIPLNLPSPPARLGALGWIGAGLGILVIGGSALSLAGFVVDQMARSVTQVTMRAQSLSGQAATTLGVLTQVELAIREAQDGTAFALMGDFNRWMEGRDPFFAGLQASSPLLRTDAGRHSPCWGKAGFLDHIILGGDAIGWLRPDSLRVLVYRETTAEMKERLSDHCPVSVRLDLPD